MKTEQFNCIEKEYVFQILGGRLPRRPITDPNGDPDDDDKTADDSQSSSS